jgi:glycosyltransferase involved in cell wall biosynthesis
MTSRNHAVLMVTRELADDRRYGLGRSLMPIVTTLQSQGWRVRYLSQEDMPDTAKESRTRWLAMLGRLPGVKNVGRRRIQLGAMTERLHMGWFAAKTAKKESFSVVYLHDPWLACGFWLGLKLLRLRSIRWGIAEHGFGCYSRATHEDGLTQGARAQRFLRRIETSILNAAHWVTAPTRISLDQIARDLALPFTPTHWHAIPHAAPLIQHHSRDDARRTLGWAQHDIHVLGIGRLAPLKRFDLLVGAYIDLARLHPTLHLQLLGGGDHAPFQQAADAAGVGDRIHFLRVDDVSPYLAAADIYVSTSSTESFGLANLEALVAKLPCICTAVGGVPEVMGLGAWLIPVDQAALTHALTELIDNPSQRKALAARAATQANQAHDLEWVTAQYAKLFQE